MSTPSIVPNDRLDKDFYLVREDFRSGPAFRETDEGVTYISLIDDLLTGQYDQVLRVAAAICASSASATLSEASRDQPSIGLKGKEVSKGLRDFIEGQLGRKLGQQLTLL